MGAESLERDIQQEIVEFLTERGWLVERMVGNRYQSGIPDLYCYHKRFGERWVEVKRSDRYSFTLRQRQKWPIWESFGCGIWILTAASEPQYALLFAPPNWRDFWRQSFQTPTKADIDGMLDELVREHEESQALKQQT